MKVRTFPSRHRLILSLGAVGILAVLGAGSAIFVQHQLSPAQASSIGACGSPEVVAASSMVPIITAAAAQTVNIPAGEPAVVATVNGEQIPATTLEQQVTIGVRNHQQTLKQLSAGAPDSVRAELQKSPEQLRKDMLNKLIDDQLYLQEGNQLGLTATLEQARTMAQQQLQSMQSQPAGSQARIYLQAYLCVNNLNESTYLTNPQVIQRYQQALTMTAARHRVIASLPPDKQKDQAAVAAALSAHAQQLRQAGQVQTFIPVQ